MMNDTPFDIQYLISPTQNGEEGTGASAIVCPTFTSYLLVKARDEGGKVVT